MVKGSPRKKDKNKQQIDKDKLLFLYGSCALKPPTSLNRRQAPPPAIIWDLDQTLVSTQGGDKDEKYKPPRKMSEDRQRRFYDFPDMEMWGWWRPGADAIIKHCHKHHDPMLVWTAGDEVYGPAIVKEVFRKFKPFKVYTRESCVEVDEGSLKKPIHILYGSKMKPENTLMIDDNPKAFEEKNMPNVILVPAYNPDLKPQGDDPDDVLVRLLVWLEKMSRTGPEDVRGWSCQGLFSPDEFNHN